ncbi:MAG TPA: NADPH-dependent F420 reductase [Acidimicrobiales bacterium]|nr:NADPH-dependent F420 reductase [Acidimicrobiales bacterium]
MRVGILGGTGPLGRGLALRLAATGTSVTIGSRQAERAASAAAEIREAWPDHVLAIDGTGNADAAEGDVIVMATPWEAAVPTVREIEERLRGKVVISVANALVREGGDMLALIPPRGSVAASVQASLPDALVAAAGHHLPAPVLGDLGRTLVADVLVCSDHRRATETAMALMGQIPGVRPLDAGGLAQAATIEAFTAVLVGLNIRYKAHSTLGLWGLDGNGRVPPRTAVPSP